ncbi:2-(1,2-epoxy-1,2-dihydrophenyl)acetyl-CoA isomerase PaaG [Acetobacter senegalensis]|uniref:2-(1,2-epoxy-1,2-dihydrophenyl)acetyl-CoA isomerase PaaG n=1 Tax=Acetobacter senegalensis TaxID=446692 RepID=UPI001EDC8D49|nr:2-(1,2-epoxy-1,2-dihydrophenyl)acetyl-CoA isomerase PaaG [Acetobacter senegalensis]MCG4260688.1 2-(1,2-epoxy-1,2-dihydrophenyl)acetyl-CoA isomerase PaaG [Acetobacter senegalensis]
MTTVLVERHPGWLSITLNRPERLNSLNDEMHAALRTALTEAREDSSCRAVLLTGSGRGFCAGQDLSERLRAPDAAAPDLGHTVETFYNPLIRQLRSLPKPIVCAVNGVAAGAGVNIALACDIVIAGKGARFVLSFAKLGLIPDSGGTYHLPRLVGEARARGLALLGEPLSAETAADWGLIWKAVEDENLHEEAFSLTKHLSEQPTFGLGQIKSALNASSHNTLDQQLDLERDLMRRAGQTDDYAEGVAAFIEKRKPHFSGLG